MERRSDNLKHLPGWKLNKMENNHRHCEERAPGATYINSKIATKQSKIVTYRLLRRYLAAGLSYVLCPLLAMTLTGVPAFAQQTETQMLSGTGSDNTVN